MVSLRFKIVKYLLIILRLKKGRCEKRGRANKEKEMGASTLR